jgi:nucleoid-associated protein YgaU
MGRLEKIVVLTVLFLVAVILGVALNPARDGKISRTSPLEDLSASRPRPSEFTALQAAPPVSSSPAKSDRPGGLLSADVRFDRQPSTVSGTSTGLPIAEQESRAGTSAPAPSSSLVAPIVNPIQPEAAPPAALPVSQASPKEAAPARAGAELLSQAGLEPSLVPDTMLYTWQAGDTFAALAQRYYGRAELADRLRTVNEGRTESNLRPGEKLFVPNPAVVAEVLSRRAVAGSPAGGSSGVYVVQKGDVLGTISQKVYGTSKKWRQIFEANQDVLADANSLREGQKLRIPQ